MSTRNLFILLFLSLFFSKNPLTAQCPITVSAGPDLIVCDVGNSTLLQGNVSGPYLGFAWSPPSGLNNPNFLNPTAIITGPITYTLTAQAVDPTATNLVTNPGFESGNSGFTSVYTYAAQPITPGTYVLTTSPALVLSSFPPCDDHTYGNGTGNMMLINGDASTGAQVWCQTIPVTPNTWYVMSGWAMASPITPPTLQFSVNGTSVGDPYPVGTGTCNWQQFSASWYSGSSSTANLCILDQITGGNGFFGDDYALDDIFFAAACTVTDEVNVDVANIEAIVPITAFLPCNAVQSGIQLDGSASSAGPNITYSWTGPGIIAGANTPIVTVNQVGNYTLTVNFDFGPTHCQVSSSLTVQDDPNIVTAFAAANEMLTCTNSTVFLDGTGSSSENTISYEWEPAFAVISGQGTLMPEVNQPGLYTLTVTNSISGCTATATATVNQNTMLPMAMANAPTPLSCAVFETTLSGMGSSSGGNFSYLWTGPGIVSGENTQNDCLVNIPGSYTLTVTNDDNGCTATATTTLATTASPPTASATSSTGNLNCGHAIDTLSSTGSSNGPGISYAWSTPDGHFTSPTNGPTATVDSAGVYILTVTNTSNGCTATASVGVSANFSQPTVGIATPIPVLNCLTDSVQLDASQSTGSPGFGLVWASQNGTFLSGDTTLMPWVGSAGVYTLTLTDTTSGCTASASATVTENSTPPIAQAGPNATLDCSGTAIPLDGSGSSTGSGFSYLWTTPNGNIVSGDTTLTPDVDGVGNYVLTVENAANGCTAIDTVAVGQDANAPIVLIELPGQLDCDTDEITLNATGSSNGPNITITWNGPGFVGGQNTLTPTVNQPGVYQLILVSTTNNCESNASVTILQDIISPVADAGPDPDAEDCNSNGSQPLDGSGSNQGPQFSYLWSNGDTSLQLMVQVPGTYYLTVTDNSNGCTAVDDVLVEGIDTIPTITHIPPDTLSCLANEVQIVLSANLGSNYTYGWENFSGQNGIVSGGGTLTPTVNEPGIYALNIFNENTGCVWYYQVNVYQSGDIPIADAGAPQTLLCGQSSLQLDGSGSSPNVSYFWTTQNGNIQNGADTPTPTVNAPGLYTLTVTDVASGCSATDDVLVGQDASAPVAVAGAPQSLTCSVLSATLNGTGSSTGPNISYLWTTTNGQISMGETTLMPTVTAAGTYLLTVTNTANNCQTLASVQVTDQSQQPDGIVAPPQPIGCTVLTSTLNGTGSSSGPNFAYLWTGPGILSGETTLMPVVNAIGVYTFQVTNTTTNCVTFAQVTVTEDLTPPTAVAAAPQQLTCLAQQVQLSGTGSSMGANFSYQWTGLGIIAGDMTLSPTANLAGSYTLTVTNSATGCTASATTVLTQNITPPVAVAAAPQSLDCLVQQVPLSGTGSSTGAGFDYLWAGPGILNGGTTLSPIVNAPGVYTLTVTSQSNGCTATASATLNQTISPPTAVAAAPQSLDCIAQQVTLNGTGSSSGAGFDYLWTGPGIVSGGTTLSPVVNAAGVYTLTVTNQANGCTATASVALNSTATPPIAVAAAPQMLTCQQTTVPLSGMGSSSGAGIAYLWAGPGIVVGGTTLQPVVNQPGVYTLTVTNQGNGCTATTQVAIGQDITPPVVDAGQSATLPCGQSSLILQGNSNVPNSAYLWTTINGDIVSGNASASPTVGEAGTYFLVVTNPANGCTALDSVVVTEGLAVFPEPNIVMPTCADPLGSISFSATSLYYYSLDGVDFTTSGLFEGLLPGNYTISIYDVIGCETTVDVSLPTFSQLSVNLPANASVQAGGSLQLSPVLNIPVSEVASVEWSPADGLNCTDCLKPTAFPDSDITYTVTVTSLDGCTASASISITVNAPEGNIYVPNAFSPNDDGINDLLTVFADEKQVKQVVSFQVFTRWGESIFEGFGLRPNDVNTGWDGTSRGKKVDLGVYAWFAEVELVNGERKLLKGDVVVVR